MTATMLDTPHTAAQAAEAAGCPYHRRAAPPPAPTQTTVELGADGVWRISGYREVRQILRNEATHQAGFMSEMVGRTAGMMKRLPVLFMEGEEHRALRNESGKFFTPNAVDKNYRDMIDTLSEDLIAKLHAKRRVDLAELTKTLAVQVAAQIIGLTDSAVPGLPARIAGILENAAAAAQPGANPIWSGLKMNAGVLAFFYLDVKPSLQKRRKSPQNDLFSYLISLGYTDIELLTEAIVFGVAGMATTREFISVAAWHILERPELREIMVNGDDDARYNLLSEILRVEPVVGDLYRRAKTDITLNTAHGVVTIPAGAKMQLSVVGGNADASVVGEAPDAVCPARPMAEMKP
ncbi:MAG: cytochrome P450, partial [Anaerolineae bacterium]|nr:cytochrome P450 [Anaerolineae bacterium]